MITIKGNFKGKYAVVDANQRFNTLINNRRYVSWEKLEELIQAEIFANGL